MIKIIKSLLLNAIAHYTLKNRLEYIRLLFRIGKPKNVQMLVRNPLFINFIYIVSLPAELKRRTFMQNQMYKQGINFRFVNAVRANGSYDRALISVRSTSYLTPGSIGCWISHCTLWRSIEKLSGCFVVLEDDVEICEGFVEKINAKLKYTPENADIIYLNSGNNYKRNRRYIINCTTFVPYQIRNGNYAYCITSKGASNLLKLVPFVEVARGGIDSAIGALIRNKKIHAYHVIEPLCAVDFSFESTTK